MKKINILFGGEAGQGPNILTHILGESLVKQGYYIFYSRDYQSLIRGGHNFNVLTISDEPVYSNEKKIDMIIALDENTIKIHEKNLGKNGIILRGKDKNMYFAGRMFKILGLDFKILEKELKELKKRFDENLKEARKGYENAEKQFKLDAPLRKKSAKFENGNQAIAKGAIQSGLDLYYAYPMTPATSVLRELAEKQTEKNFLTFELENEIAVINAAIGSAITGARAMVGTSGGGFDLMAESLSLAGMINIPLVIFLSQRPGPATGVPTYTAQGDLNTARCTGHGEFPRLLVAPGDLNESEELTNQAFYFAEKYKIPSIIINDKHLGESYYTETEDSKMIKIKKSTPLARHSGNETDENTASSCKQEIVEKRVKERMEKMEEIRKESKKFKTYKIYGNAESRNLIVFWGSTKGAILDSIKDLDCKALQILYLKPFPVKVKNELKKASNLILIENNETGQLGDLIAEKTGVFFKETNKILKYNGRPFLSDELKKEIEKRLE
ncbi:MAG: 2-oxoacid:acceptor oxidoreductase family protein [Nanoarchaeota archaeon]|nr:2-oxoacid:acceptor oxidoreductase family protein [Nanoarchaeota archaeon]